MSSQERHRNNKKYVFKGGNFILSPLNPKNISLNLISANKKENKNKNNSNILTNNLSTKKAKKNLNQEFVKSNPNLLAFSRVNNSFINSIKINNNNTPRKNFVNYTNNNINYIKKLYVNKKSKENNYFMNNSKSHNKSSLGDKKLSYEYLKTDIQTSYSNIFKKEKKFQNIPNINLLFPRKNNFQKSNSNYYEDFLGSSSGLFKRDFPNLKFNSPENIQDKINIIYNKSKDDKVNSESGTNQSTNDSKITKKKRMNINMEGNKKGENIVFKGPEELHWYFVKSIQDGKKFQTKFDYN